MRSYAFLRVGRFLLACSLVVAQLVGGFGADATPGVTTAVAEGTQHSLALNGTTAFAEAADAPGLNLTADWTMELWFKDESPEGYFHIPRVLLTKGNPLVDRQVPYGFVIAFNVLAVGERSGDGGRLLTYNLVQHHVSPNAWHHAAATLQSASGTLSLYLDGVLVARRSAATDGRIGNSRPLSIGRDGASGFYWRGKLDDIRLWNVARTGDQIRASYAQQLSPGQASLVANWQFDEINGIQAHDSAGTHVAVLHGAATFSADDAATDDGHAVTVAVARHPSPSVTPSPSPSVTRTATVTPSVTATATATPAPDNNGDPKRHGDRYAHADGRAHRRRLRRRVPPGSSSVAPPLDSSLATDVLTATQFLYTGSNPIQTGVAPDAIDPARVAVLCGRVMTRDGQPLPGVRVSVHQHPELGQTLSRSDGHFDLAVNGGGLVLLDYTGASYPPSGRSMPVAGTTPPCWTRRSFHSTPRSLQSTWRRPRPSRWHAATRSKTLTARDRRRSCSQPARPPRWFSTTEAQPQSVGSAFERPSTRSGRTVPARCPPICLPAADTRMH